MLKEGLKYIAELGRTNIYKDLKNGQAYSDKDLYLIQEPRAAAVKVQSLTGLIAYLKSNFDSKTENIMVHIKDPKTVVAFSPLNVDRNRETLIIAEAFTPDFSYERFYELESFNIKLQSTFVDNESRDLLLKIVGNVTETDVQNYGDDGVSQSVTAKTGVATVSQVVIPNKIELAPYRTFIEVPQPESNFVFRMRKGPAAALFESDGGAWQLDAMQSIKDYLESQLQELISAKAVHIIS